MHDSYILYRDCAYWQPRLETIVDIGRTSALYSARLGTGIFGDPHCSAGNRGPAGREEVLFAAGDEGLVRLVRLGFLPCPVCKPQDAAGFWEKAGPTVGEKCQGVTSVEAFASLPFDARRVDWELLIPLTGSPGRMYVPKGLNAEEVEAFRERLQKLHARPAIGYYDRTAPGRFVQY